MENVLAIYKEKLQFMMEQYAITADPMQKFALKKQIEELEQQMKNLEQKLPSTPPAEDTWAAITALIIANRLKEAAQALSQQLSPQTSHHKNLLIGIQAQINALREREAKRTISYDIVKQEEAQLRESLLYLVNELKGNNFP